jgi:hypothetical protein
MEAQAGATAPSSQQGTTKRTALIAVVVIAGAILFAALQSAHAPAPDSGYAPVGAARPSVLYSSNAPDASAVSGYGAAGARFGNLTFHGYACTLDCSGHEAGYRWGKVSGASRPGDCPNMPPYFHSVTEGCWAEAGRQGP